MLPKPLRRLYRRWKSPLKTIERLLETRALVPSYSGLLLGSLAIFFFIAASNTMAGWLYVMSGLLLAMLGLAAVLSVGMLREIQVRRWPIPPVTAGEPLSITLALTNPTKRPKVLLQIQDALPKKLGLPSPQVLELLPAGATQHVTTQVPTERRGIYRWQNVDLRTGAPLGLFWGKRSWRARAIATVYPEVLPLSRCPLLDRLGRDQNLQILQTRRTQDANEGVTRSLRPYRWGDPIRLVHWRSSAKHGELRLRELETITGGEEVVIALDTAAPWPSEQFEAAVIAAASLYFYGVRQQLKLSLWTARTGLLQGEQNILQALAATYSGETVKTPPPTDRPILWLSTNLDQVRTIGSRFLLWQEDTIASPPGSAGVVIRGDRPLAQQLQSELEIP
jgi:uncharacterized protein (DUF58 family)